MYAAVPLLSRACPSSAGWLDDLVREIAEKPEASWWLTSAGRRHVSVNRALPFELRVAAALPATLFDRWLDRLGHDDLLRLLSGAAPRSITADVHQLPLDKLLERADVRRQAVEGVFEACFAPAAASDGD
ncbi:hypothetical protein SAE02_61800 [Skermanella aerolata]|uniref:Uncharacterized protein n=1 Tax=Skermanella aerolata TaxID=393310 RepID=A0A512E013_9PROT|nr:hypothetical protein [Skermanella aerolata]KJB91861.1 hypothetical protein N826_25430 [Skermanella aerolata KACC 11604]GEO42032.1 hypothetical protein SAE02_61800 [Skermanella aerolata]